MELRKVLIAALAASTGLSMAGASPTWAGAADQAPPTPKDGELRWVIRPNAMEANLIVSRLSRMHGEMRATVECAVGNNGFLTRCTVISEDPVGRGVGQAAIAVAVKYKAASRSTTGARTAGRLVRLPMRFMVRG